MKKGFVDIHHHLAYGIDDGPKNLDLMKKMIQNAAKDGIGTIIATPHATPGILPFNMERYHQLVEEARAYCAEADIKMEILEGCEVLYTDHAPRLLGERRIPTLAGTDYVLVEFSPDIPFPKLCDALDKLNCEGFCPVLAHAERYECLCYHPKRVERLHEEKDFRIQVNCSSIIQKKGFFLRRFIKYMLDRRLIDALGTDAHNVTFRAVNMKEAYETVKAKCGTEYADHLTNGSFLED